MFKNRILSFAYLLAMQFYLRGNSPFSQGAGIALFLKLLTNARRDISIDEQCQLVAVMDEGKLVVPNDSGGMAKLLHAAAGISCRTLSTHHCNPMRNFIAFLCRLAIDIGQAFRVDPFFMPLRALLLNDCIETSFSERLPRKLDAAFSSLPFQTSRAKVGFLPVENL